MVRLFSQVYIILADDAGGIHRVKYALLQKNCEIYRKSFTI